MKSKKVYIRTLGCQMNEYDSELIRAVLDREGFIFVPDAKEADIALLNTCSVRDNAVRKVFNAVHAIRNEHGENPLIIGILGCIATHLKDELLDKKNLPVDFIAGPDSYRRLGQMIQEVRAKRGRHADIDLSEEENYEGIYPKRAEGVNAWVAVMRGCDNFCTFCVVPYARGRERSRSVESVLDEVRTLAQEGFPQVTLLGQNVNSYAHEGADFAALLEEVSRIEKIKRIRFMSPHPKDFPARLIDVVAQNPKVCKHIHLPLQSGNNRVLKLMNRNYTQKQFLDLAAQIKKACPNITLTTDIIIGFPSETEKEFEDTRFVLERVGFESAFIFKYSPRPGTFAAKKFKDDVSDEAKKRRITALNTRQKEISLQEHRKLIGKTLEILLEEEHTQKSSEDFQGRAQSNVIVIVPRGPYKKGDFLNVKITGCTTNVLKGSAV